MKTSKSLLFVLLGCVLTAANLSAQTVRAARAPAIAVRPGHVAVTPARPIAVRPIDRPIAVRPVDRSGNPRIEAARIEAARIKAARIKAARLKATRIENARKDAANHHLRRRLANANANGR